MKVINGIAGSMLVLLGLTSVYAKNPTEPLDSERLLDRAYSAVSEMPLDPHIKNRSREQYKVVGAALTLDRPDLADRYALGIAYWQQGAALADLALYYIEKGNGDEGRNALKKAESWLKNSDRTYRQEEAEQAWRLSRVGIRIAMAYTALSEDEKVAEIMPHVGKDDAPRLLQYKISKTNTNTFEQSEALLSSLADTGEYEALKSAVDGFADLYRLFYKNETSRKRVAKKIEVYRPKLPILFQIDLLVRLGGIALENRDHDQARIYADEAADLLQKRNSPPRFYIPRMAEIAALRWKAGDVETAQQDLTESLRLFAEKRKTIINMDRAGILCAVAEAYADNGKKEKALSIYSRALAEGEINPNSRPRATDLSLVCRSMALHGVQPSVEVLQALEEMKNKLGNPW